MSLSQIFSEIERGEAVGLPAGWLQGRTIYGGLVAAMLVHKAILTVNDPEKCLLSTSITFVGPVQEASVRLTAEILRQGKSVTSIEVRLWQDDAVQSILLASFGTQRDSAIEVHHEKVAPAYPGVDQLMIVPDNPFAPQCFQQFELAWAEGNYPCTASKMPDFGGWFRFDPTLHESRDMSVADLMALMDVWPPGVLPMLKIPAPASSLNWHVSFVSPIQYNMHDWFKYRVVTDHAEHGYAIEYACIWDAQDRLVAISGQTVTVFA
ncbi:thioesterase family protein [Acinetobacter sp. WZC-1]|uniref:thioesterase family protein n=1 Tax=Acinetobacter sp. WZC-1 TaxID=3459034 RepID=UPI00403DEE8B